MKMLLKSDIWFEAENLDDAFKKLSEHFSKLRYGHNTDLIEFGEMHLETHRNVTSRRLFYEGK